MVRVLIALFVVLHGLVHLWYFTLSRGLVEFKPEMGWTGRSWILTGLLGDATTRSVASALYVLATVAFVAGGIGLLARAEWWRPVLVSAALLSSALIFLMWDGSMQMLVVKGLIGLLISLAILAALLVLRWPAAAF